MAIETKAMVKGRKAKRRSLLVKCILILTQSWRQAAEDKLNFRQRSTFWSQLSAAPSYTLFAMHKTTHRVEGVLVCKTLLKFKAPWRYKSFGFSVVNLIQEFQLPVLLCIFGSSTSSKKEGIIWEFFPIPKTRVVIILHNRCWWCQWQISLLPYLSLWFNHSHRNLYDLFRSCLGFLLELCYSRTTVQKSDYTVSVDLLLSKVVKIAKSFHKLSTVAKSCHKLPKVATRRGA